MSLSISIGARDSATGDLRRVVARMQNASPMLEVMANAARRTLQDHFRARPDNAKGWPSSGFWRQVAALTAVATVGATSATVAISHPGLAQRLYGGTITPKRGKYLAIPANAAAYKAGSPREGSGDHLEPLIVKRDGKLRAIALVERSSQRLVRKKDGSYGPGKKSQAGQVWYWLVESVTQAADPAAMPGADVLHESCRAAAVAFLRTPYARRTLA
jgi:hypothetical protein